MTNHVLKVVHPKSNNEVLESEKLVFLAGPIQGAPDWQSEFSVLVGAMHPDSGLVFATPRVPEELDSNFDYTEQVLWEKRHILRAVECGVLVFWWCAQDFSIPYEQGRSYAQTSRLEFGRAIGWLDYNSSIPLVVGIDPEYSKLGGGSERYIREMCNEYGILIADSLSDLKDKVISRIAG